MSGSMSCRKNSSASLEKIYANLFSFFAMRVFLFRSGEAGKDMKGKPSGDAAMPPAPAGADARLDA
jgi:hypothetical protein